MAIRRGVAGLQRAHIDAHHPWIPVWSSGSMTPRSQTPHIRDAAIKVANNHQLTQAAAGRHVNVRVRQEERGFNFYTVEEQPAFCSKCWPGKVGALPAPERTTASHPTGGVQGSQYRSLTVKEKNRLNRLAGGKEVLPAPMDRSAVQSAAQKKQYDARRQIAQEKRAAAAAKKAKTPKKP